MTTKKKTATDPLVAAADIFVDGKPFEAGENIIGVAKDQIDAAVSQKRVVRKSVYDKLAEGVPAPELGGHLSPDEELEKNHGTAGDDDSDYDDGDDTGDTGASDDNGGSDQ